MMKKTGGALAGVALFILGTLLLVNYVKSAEDRVSAESEPIEVLVVSQPVAAGESPTLSVRIEEVPQRLVVDDAVRADDSLENLIALAELMPGEQLLWSRLGAPDEVQTALEPTRVEVPEGYLAVTIPVGADRSLGGLLAPGMHVAVLGSFELEVEAVVAGASTTKIQTTNILVHKALVVEVQSDIPLPSAELAELGIAAAAPEGSFLVTIAAPAYDVERIIFAAEWGTIWLAREELDSDEAGSRVQSGNTIFDKVDPSAEPYPITGYRVNVAPDLASASSDPSTPITPEVGDQ